MKNILDDISRLLYQKKYKEVNKLLINFVEKTLKESSSINYLSERKKIYQTIYRSFNEYYLNWLKRNKINIKKKEQLFKPNGHTNYLIGKCSKVPEMDDLLFELGNYLNNLNSKEQKKEVLYHLQCYKISEKI